MAGSARSVIEAYFDAIARRDLEAIGAVWAPDGVDRIVGQAELAGPEGVRGYFRELFGAVPDFALTVRDIVGDDETVAVYWGATGTFAGPGSFMGIQPTGTRIELEGLDLLRVRDGLIVHNDAFPDGIGFAQQIGMLPRADSAGERRLRSIFNARTTAAMAMATGKPERVADGVWLVRGGFPQRTFNVYLIADGDGVLLFDAGTRRMAKGLAAAGATLGGITRIVLGHGHKDHRGAAPALGAPVFCHADNVRDAAGDGGGAYQDFSYLRPPGNWLLPRLVDFWDGGPVEIAGTVAEGDDIAGFQVVDVPGHAPGMIALWRESDRLALSTDTFYTLDIGTGRKIAPQLPGDGANWDTEQARQSLRKLAALDPASAWPGHARPVTGDVRSQLERAAAS